MRKQETDELCSRRLDDEELDSGDDVDRTDRFGDEAEEEEERQYVQQERVTMDLELPRQPIPEPSDGEVRQTHRICCNNSTDVYAADVSTQDAIIHLHPTKILRYTSLPTTYNGPP